MDYSLVRRSTPLALLTAATILACEGSRSLTSTVTPRSLTVRVHVAAELSSAAQALGWTSNAVPNAIVVAELSSAGSGQSTPSTSTTDASGISRLPDLRLGTYTLRVSRALMPNEISRAGATLRDIDGLAGIATITISPSSGDTVDVDLRGTGGSALVFSEVYETEPLIGNGGVYYYGGYLKIYNNSDTTVSLADKLLFEAIPGVIDGPVTGCSTFAAVQNDPAGLWAVYIFRFPPESPNLAPGGAVAIATDAIDHRQVKNAAGFFDLSHAAFEFKGTQDARNPLALGMLDVGPRPFIADGHGWRTNGLRTVIGLSLPLDLALLPKHFDPIWGGGQTLLRISKETLLDVVQWKPIGVGPGSQYPDCPSSVVSGIDGAEARNVVYFTDTLSMHRRVNRMLPTGRVLLQRSRNSAADWVAAPATPYLTP